MAQFIDAHQNVNFQQALSNLRAQLAGLSSAIDETELLLERRNRVRFDSSQVARARIGGSRYELFGQQFSVRNGNELFTSVLRHFAELDQKFPDHFSVHLRSIGRKRPYVARTADDVYPGRKDLAKYTTSFAPGWFVGTNESNEKKLALLRIACRTIGISFGKDLKVNL